MGLFHPYNIAEIHSLACSSWFLAVRCFLIFKAETSCRIKTLICF
ncbi:hypothetical protein NC99_27440 [Sunxiuqinia dokdonensis]|uniref:Uncharacterized protein n=1 Tax=Sunxiuqinia dokdonensis TaxID=1409788 RepID=A0A0L8V7U4_9BACT|nr:hypothetical protein NC99_27440 [Sunxiuqinia dokdonensis]